MTLRIEQVSDGHVVILPLSGRLQSEHLEELKAHIEGITQKHGPPLRGGCVTLNDLARQLRPHFLWSVPARTEAWLR